MEDDYDEDRDFYDDDAEDCCCHEDAELSFDGHFHCYQCGYRWWASSGEIAAYWAAYERAHRPPTWRERIHEMMASIKWRLAAVFRSPVRHETDDDIPF